MEVLEGPILVHGPRAQRFEEDFAAFVGGGRAVSVSSCTAALHLSYFYLGLGPGDEVIVPAQTHTATAHAVEFTRARPVFVDAEPRTGNLDLEQVEAAIGPRTRAISLVHFLGTPVDMARLTALARKHQLFVVEDCALALGSRFQDRHVGLWGDVGCFSFYPVKHMTTAEGGMLLTRHPEVAEAVARQRAFGVDRHVGERKVPGVYDVTRLGYNYRLNEIQAALGVVQLSRMPQFLERRRRNFHTLARALAEVEEVQVLGGGEPPFQGSYYCLSVVLAPALVERRLQIVEHLRQAGVGTSVYYPRPVPHLSYYRHKYGYGEDSFPVAARISYGSIALPVGPHLEPEDMEYVASCLKEAIAKVR
jgi:dTDP-4-amino-4,6-dideoxygalactose transaminase